MLGLLRQRPIPCLGCGYDITGLARDAVCPECALPLKETLEASQLLRGCPKKTVQRLDRGAFLLACAPTLFAVSLALGFVLLGFWAFFIDVSKAAVGLAIGVGVSWLLSPISLIAGIVLLTIPIPGRPLRPGWAVQVMRYAGIVAGASASLTPFLRSVVLRYEPFSTLAIRLISQAATLAFLASAILVCRGLERQTQLGQRDQRTYRFQWAVVGLLGVGWLWILWLEPAWHGTFSRYDGGEWGEAGALLAFAIQGDMYWRTAGTVATEWRACNYGANGEATHTIAP